MNNPSRSPRRGVRACGSLLAVVAALSVGLPPLTVAAQQQPTKAAQQEAGSRFRKGLDLFRDGDYQAALIEFRRAYELAPNYNVLYNIGQVYFQLQDYPNALNALERYSNEGGANVPASRRVEVERDIEKLKSRVANLDITVNIPDAEITLDDAPIGKSPLAKPVMVSAGKHKLSVTKAGFNSVTKVIEVASGDTPKIALELTENKGPVINIEAPPITTATTPPPPPTTPPAVIEPPPPKSVPWAGWAVTGGLTVGAVITGVLALGASGDLKTERESATATAESLSSAKSKVQTFALVTDILAGGAIVAGGVTLYFTLAGGSSSEKPKPAAGPGPQSKRPSPFMTPQVRVGVGPGSVSLHGTF